MSAKEQLPDPASHAKTVLALVEGLLEPVPYLSRAIAVLQNKRIERGQELLIEEIKKSGVAELTELTEVQYNFFISAAYRFMEQVRLGEYEHNLRIVSRVIAGEMAESEQPDVGRVARAARCLEMATQDEIICIANINRAKFIHFEETKNQPEISERDLRNHSDAFTPESLAASLDEARFDVEWSRLINSIWSIERRGIISEGKHWFTAQEKTGYICTQLYDEIINSCG